MKALVTIVLFCLSSLGMADETVQSRATFNYQMFCQGCHTPDGSGFKSVPQLKNHVGKFLETDRGREYLVRVPGSATSALDSEELAEVLNWILAKFGGDSLAPDYQPYTSNEVAVFRQNPLNEVVHYRTQLLAEIANGTTKE